MEVVLLDAERFLQKYNQLQTKIQPLPELPPSTLLGLVLLYKENINNPLHYYFTFHSKEKDICYLTTIPRLEDTNLVLPYLTQENTVWTSLPLSHPDFQKQLDLLIKYGFHHPYLCDKTPLEQSLTPSLALCRKKRSSVKYDEETIRNKINYVLEHQLLPRCNLTAQFSPEAISFLKKGSLIGHTENQDNSVSQKEISGQMYVSKIKQQGGDYVYIINVDYGSIQHGKEEEVSVVGCNFNFHTHPQEAYKRHEVKKAWPSLTDFVGFLKIGKETIFHTVITMEGVYLIYLGPYWSTRIKKISRAFVKEKYHIPHTRQITPQQFADKINTIKYKGHPIFQVIYVGWNKINQPFSLSFSKYEGQCFPTDNGKQMYKFLHE